MKQSEKLKELISPYSPQIQKIAFELRSFITNIIPEANELIWDNYNAVAIAYSKSEFLKDAFCHIAVYSKYVNFGFNRGTELSKIKIKLEGKGKLIRHLKVSDLRSFPKKIIEKMIIEAVEISELRNPELNKKETEGTSFVMSISEKKIRPI